MRTKLPPTKKPSLLSDAFIKMKKATSMYMSTIDGTFRVWCKGKKVHESKDFKQADAEYERRCQE